MWFYFRRQLSFAIDNLADYHGATIDKTIFRYIVQALVFIQVNSTSFSAQYFYEQFSILNFGGVITKYFPHKASSRPLLKCKLPLNYSCYNDL